MIKNFKHKGLERMTLLRPGVTDALHKGQEVIAAAFVILVGLWLTWLGGYLLVPVGLLVMGLGAILAHMAWRRMRFAQVVGAPGLVELDEAQVGYLGPGDGGFLSLEELVELRLMRLHGKRMWRLKQADGQALLIPVDAKGADRRMTPLPGCRGWTRRRWSRRWSRRRCHRPTR